MDLRQWYQKGRAIEVRSGQQTRFWLDCWLGDCPLKIQFPNLFIIASNPDLEVANACVDGQWCIAFRRQLNENLRQDWANLEDLLRDVTLSEGHDKAVWALEKSHKYSAKSLYNAMTWWSC